MDRAVGVEQPPAEACLTSARLRIAIPERILWMTEYGLQRQRPTEESWWHRVEREMDGLVRPHLPKDAVAVVMQLDSDALEVVVDYALPL